MAEVKPPLSADAGRLTWPFGLSCAIRPGRLTPPREKISPYGGSFSLHTLRHGMATGGTLHGTPYLANRGDIRPASGNLGHLLGHTVGHMI